MADIRIEQAQEGRQVQQDLQDLQDPTQLARSVAEAMAETPEEVGDFIEVANLGEGVGDFRFISNKVGYEGWQWSVTLYHDMIEDRWTVDESSLAPTKDSLLPPDWVPWKDRLLASDLSVTDVIGTDPNDKRMESGVKTTLSEQDSARGQLSGDAQRDMRPTESSASVEDTASSQSEVEGPGESDAAEPSETVHAGDDKVTPDAEGSGVSATIDSTDKQGEATDFDETVNEFDLSRRHVMSAIGREETAKRWYQGQHGPKSLSTKAADGNLCSSCAFFIGLKGQLGTMFGVCANRWSLDDGRVVSTDHGCGEHSEIEQPEPTHLWVQSAPAFDDMDIEVVEQAPRELRGPIELIEQAEGIDDVEQANSSEEAADSGHR